MLKKIYSNTNSLFGKIGSQKYWKQILYGFLFSYDKWLPLLYFKLDLFLNHCILDGQMRTMKGKLKIHWVMYPPIQHKKLFSDPQSSSHCLFTSVNIPDTNFNMRPVHNQHSHLWEQTPLSTYITSLSYKRHSTLIKCIHW